MAATETRKKQPLASTTLRTAALPHGGRLVYAGPIAVDGDCVIDGVEATELRVRGDARLKNVIINGELAVSGSLDCTDFYVGSLNVGGDAKLRASTDDGQARVCTALTTGGVLDAVRCRLKGSSRCSAQSKLVRCAVDALEVDTSGSDVGTPHLVLTDSGVQRLVFKGVPGVVRQSMSDVTETVNGADKKRKAKSVCDVVAKKVTK